MVEIGVQMSQIWEVGEEDTEEGPLSVLIKFEEAVRADPTALPTWLKYISFLTKISTSNKARYSKLFSTYERALAALPTSEKLWRDYAHEFRTFAQKHHPLHASRAAARSVSERAAHMVHSSSVLWVELLQDQLADHCLTDARNTVNAALRALPITEHEQIWAIILAQYPWNDAPLPAVHLLRRYAMFAPDEAPMPLAHALIAASRIDDGLDVLRRALADTFWAPDDTPRHKVFLLFIKTAARHATSVRSTPVSDVVRAAVLENGASVGELWATLAEFYIRRGDFSQARSVLEHAVTSVTVVRDFAVAFDAYTKLEESLVEVLASNLEKHRGGSKEHQLEQEVSLQLTRLEHLVDRRPMLLSDVHLRQNVHNVHEWHKRMRMLKAVGEHAAVVEGYFRAIRAIDTEQATHGRKHTLWLAFACYYEQSGDLASARQTLEGALADEENFRTAEDVAAVWCEYAEMELRAGDLVKATNILRRALTFDSRSDQSLRFSVEDEKPTVAVKRSRRLWLFLLDMLRSNENVDDITAAHTRMLDARVATPSSILHGAEYLEERRLFERAFRLYDRAATALAWPESVQIWVIYLSKFVERYGSKRVERARDLFEEAILSAPTIKSSGVSFPHPQVKILYLMYAEMEERFSMSRHALAVLERAARAVREEDRSEIYRLYIVKTATLLGVSRTRPVYVEALQSMRDLEAVVEFACRFSVMERRLGEIDRARAIYVECCRVVDTRVGGNFARFWKDWEEFEVEMGDEDDVKNMLRWKRRVQLDHQNVLLEPNFTSGEGISNMVRGGEIGGGPGVSAGDEDGPSLTDGDRNKDAAGDSPDEAPDDVDVADEAVGTEIGSHGNGPNSKVDEAYIDNSDETTGAPHQVHLEAAGRLAEPQEDVQVHPEDDRHLPSENAINDSGETARQQVSERATESESVRRTEASAPVSETKPLSIGVKRLLAKAYEERAKLVVSNSAGPPDATVVIAQEETQTASELGSEPVKRRRKRRWDVEAS